MKVNTIIEFHDFINDLDLDKGYTKEFLYNIFECKDRDFYILELEKRYIIRTSQSFSLDSDRFATLKRQYFYELYIEMYSNNNVDTTVLTFKTLEDLKKVGQFIKDNFKFLEKEGKNDKE